MEVQHAVERSPYYREALGADAGATLSRSTTASRVGSASAWKIPGRPDCMVVGAEE